MKVNQFVRFICTSITEGVLATGKCLANRLPACCVLCLALHPGALRGGEHHDHDGGRRVSAGTPSPGQVATAEARKPITELPPLPPGVTELKFSEFFVTPVGTRGLELTDKLRQLEGQRVRMLGYMVHQEESPPGMFLFSPLPAQVHEHDNGLADDLPPSTVRVLVPTCREQVVPFAPGLMLLTGTLSVGNRAEADGRVSLARLELDPPAHGGAATRQPNRLSAPSGKGAERLVPATSRKSIAAPRL